ncbi:hypothetical protein BELL_0008g00150 [Botrytis elliptica]|uniref:2EXR domain-containing protein n=1 Tax=Botrytis elliptica TaxID=278938 RepID=A0A4Z1K8G5_9HELO|nr:hypothetical protein EAE99_000236 [Botrytis elliptica]TGO80380.1 hypothetical protein BELL_0008g00150 [Botrytis elliptica]
MSPNTMSNTDAMTDEALDSLNSGVEQLAICNLQQETNKSDSCTNEGETTPATDIQQIASTLKSFPESETSTSSDTISREALSTFTPFPRLAVELRLAIWSLACSQERLLEITTHPTDESFDLGAPTPSILFVKRLENITTKDIFDCTNMKYSRNYWQFKDYSMFYYDAYSGHSIGTWLQNLFDELRTVKCSHWNSHDGVEFLGHRAVTLMPNLKKYILTPLMPDIPQHIMDAFACRNKQNVCIEEMQSALQKENKKNPACPTPVVEFEISVQASSSAL